MHAREKSLEQSDSVWASDDKQLVTNSGELQKLRVRLEKLFSRLTLLTSACHFLVYFYYILPKC